MKKLIALILAALALNAGSLAEGATTMTIPQTGMTVPVPAACTATSDHPGSLVRVDYKSEDYLRGDAPVDKTAWVYLPYGYDENDTETRYDILYLMHGWGGAAGEYFYMGDGMIKNMLDHMIENGEIRPIIAVSATFYNESSGVSSSIGPGEIMPTASIRALRSSACTRLIMSCSWASICRAHSAARRPFSLRRTRFFVRSNSLTPMISSSFCMDRVSVGWVRCSFSDAADSVPHSWTAVSCSNR